MLWSELAPILQTGDVILFHQSGLISTLIDLVTDGHFSHVAMVVRHTEDDGSEELTLWQSFEPEGGVVMDPLPAFLHKYMKDYQGIDFAVRRLSVDRTPEMNTAMEAFIGNVKGRPFPSILGMVKRYFEGKLGIDSGEDAFFCSDLVADTYIKMGLFQDKPPPNFYAPKNFSTGKDIHFLLGASYSERISFTMDL